MFYFQGEIDAREDSYESTLDAGTKLVETDHYAADEVREKVGMFTQNIYSYSPKQLNRTP